MPIPNGHGVDVRGADHRDRGEARRGDRAIGELAVGVVAPALDGTVVEHGAGVDAVGEEVRGVREAADRPREVAIDRAEPNTASTITRRALNRPARSRWNAPRAATLSPLGDITVAEGQLYRVKCSATDLSTR